MNKHVSRPMSHVCALAICAAATAALVAPRALADAPDAYLDYVESSGSQYIDTGVIGADGLLVEAEMEWTAVPASGWACFLGSAASESVMYCPYRIYDAATHRMAYKNQNPAVQGSSKPVAGVRYHVVVSMDDGAQTNTIRRCEGGAMSRVYTKSGTLVSDWRELAGPVDTQRPMFVFARNLDGTADQFASARLYSLRIWRKDGNGDYELVRHFLPCSKGGVAALYDKVEGTIRYPQGGALVAGATLPRPAELVEWVQSDGADGDRRLFIDTKVVAKAGVGMTAEMEWREKATTNFFCGATGSDGKRIWLYYAEPNGGVGNATHKFGYNDWRMQIGGGGNSPSIGVRYRIDAYQNRSPVGSAISNQVLSVRSLTGAAYYGERVWNDAAAIDAQQALYLFANNCAGTAGSNICARLYSLILTNELGVARDFLPCVADNGRAGLYDSVSERVFFPQAATEGATAEFRLATEVGAVTNHPATTKWPLLRPEWIEANGTNDYVDLGVMARDGTRMLAEVEWNALPAAGTFCGAATNSSTALFTTYRITTGENSNYHRMGYYNGSSTLGGGNARPATGIRYRVETSLANGEQVIAVAKSENGSWVPVGNGTRPADLSFPAGYADLGLPLYLFARNFNGVPDEFAPARLYSFKLWQGGTLVRDLHPVFDPVDNAPALFDKVTKRYYHNDGGYRLTAGGESSPFPGAATFWVLH